MESVALGRKVHWNTGPPSAMEKKPAAHAVLFTGRQASADSPPCPIPVGPLGSILPSLEPSSCNLSRIAIQPSAFDCPSWAFFTQLKHNHVCGENQKLALLPLSCLLLLVLSPYRLVYGCNSSETCQLWHNLRDHSSNITCIRGGDRSELTGPKVL